LTLFEGQGSLAPTVLHLQFADELTGIPVTRSGNPVPGHFACPFAITPASGRTVYSFDLRGCPVHDADGDGTVFAAAHFGISHPGGVGSLGEFLLPGSPASLALTHGGVEFPTYFPSIVVSGAGALDGTYSGWCADPNRWITNGPAMLYSTYDAAAMAQVAALLDPPTTLLAGGLPVANSIVNRYVAGTTPITPVDASCNPLGGGDVRPPTMWTIQLALWYVLTGQLIEDDPHAMAIACEMTASSRLRPRLRPARAAVRAPRDERRSDPRPGRAHRGPGSLRRRRRDRLGGRLDGRRFAGARQWGTYFEYDLSCAP
jgi:hypothetical protein